MWTGGPKAIECRQKFRTTSYFHWQRHGSSTVKGHPQFFEVWTLALPDVMEINWPNMWFLHRTTVKFGSFLQTLHSSIMFQIFPCFFDFMKFPWRIFLMIGACALRKKDLEDVFFEHYEEGGDVWLSALTFMQCKSHLEPSCVKSRESDSASYSHFW